jgi:hypothetical protein
MPAGFYTLTSDCQAPHGTTPHGSALVPLERRNLPSACTAVRLKSNDGCVINWIETEPFVGLFTKTAYQILRRELRPLTAREITEIACRSGDLKSQGKTPWQTMKSKLSTDILSRGEKSLFMRVEKGRFSLREWKGSYTEHVAQRFHKALFDEDIVVFPSTSLKRYVPTVGLSVGDFDQTSLLGECRPMRRRVAEEDTSVIQLVSVFIVRFQDKYLTYKRTKRLPESRLHGYYSLAFGGHLNPDDVKPLLNIFNPRLAAPLLLRELGEELRLDPAAAPTLRTSKP